MENWKSYNWVLFYNSQEGLLQIKCLCSNKMCQCHCISDETLNESNQVRVMMHSTSLYYKRHVEHYEDNQPKNGTHPVIHEKVLYNESCY